jgi:DNA polymerase-2
VPGIGYTICERRHGLVSRALGPIIGKRVLYKALRREAKARGDREAHDRCENRQSALKWMLVCCFGYLGYRNARFGRIEAHEAVSAYSREILTRAREICEERGWHMLHANVDCVWIVKPGFTDDEVAGLMEEIEARTGLPIALEGIYNWIAFLPSRQVADRPVPSRYFGAFRDGSVKYRGIECRRRDVPEFVKRVQLELLAELAKAATLAEFRAMVPAILSRVREIEESLWRRDVAVEELVIRQSLSQEPDEYRGNGSQALAARQAAAAGIPIHAGETLSYILTSDGDADRSRRVRVRALMDADTTYDPLGYVRLLRRAVNTLLWPAGVSLEEERLAPPWAPPPRPPRRPAGPDHAQLDLFGT